MPKNDDRLLLWRNTIQLFHSYKKIGFTGPFFAQGYTNYRIESPLTERKTGLPLTPDIFACGPEGWVVIDLTCDDRTKKDQLDKYKNLDSRSLSTYGCRAYDTLPDTMSSRLSFEEDGNHCELVVKDTFDVRKTEFIQDPKLRNEVNYMKGQNMNKLPEIPFSLVPEMKHYEIRRGIVDIVMQIFDTSSEGKTPAQMCEEGLERLFTLVTPSARQSLINKIQNEMRVLIENDLPGYIEYKDNTYRATEKFKQYPKSRNAVALKLREWAYPTQRTLGDYPGQEE